MNSHSFRSLASFILLLFISEFILANPLHENPVNLCGSGTLSGKITEKDKNSPLAGATVYIPDLKLGVITDNEGNYKFNNLPSGTYLVEIHYIGFKTFTKTITVSGPVTQDFALSDQYVEESTVVVTGQSKATRIKQSPVPIVAISHDYITTNLSTNIIDAIAKVPGVSALTTGPAA